METLDLVMKIVFGVTMWVGFGIAVVTALYLLLKAVVITITTEQLIKELGNDYLELKNIDKVKLRSYAKK